MHNSNPLFPDFQKGYDAGCVDIVGMGFKTSRDKFNADFKPGEPISDRHQRAWALGYSEALLDAES